MSSVPALGADDVHVWLAFDAPDIATPAPSPDILDEAERERAARMASGTVRRQFVVARHLRRSVLSAYAPEVAPEQWRFVVGEHGKPALAAPFDATGLHFNAAHTKGLVALAVAREPIVGVDVENISTRTAPLRIAARYFDAAEAQALDALPENQRQRRFFALWTLKESWLKATGRGLAAGLDNVSFALDREHAATGVVFAAEPAEPWRFWQSEPSADHMLALALHTERDTAFRARLLLWPPASADRRQPAAPRALGRSAF